MTSDPVKHHILSQFGRRQMTTTQSLAEQLEEKLSLQDLLWEIANQAGDPYDGNAPAENLLKANLRLLKTIEKRAVEAANRYKAEAALRSRDSVIDGTPSSRWKAEGKEDPHDNRYDCERSRLCRGNLTDDEIANAVYLDPNIGNLTAAKDRIRWLSRALERALSSHAETAGEAFKIGDQVEKYTGDYQIVGVVRSVFTMVGGATRYVVEHKAEGGGSFLHIYSAKNLRAMIKAAKGGEI